MKDKTYILSSHLSADAATARIGDLLTKAGVQYRTEGPAISSTRTPIALGSFDRTTFSETNWVGLNPFTLISGVNVRCQLDKSGLTEIMVQVNRGRTFLWLAFLVSIIGMTASGLPTLEDAIFFIIALSLVAWFGLVSFLGGYLIKKEITNCLNA